MSALQQAVESISQGSKIIELSIGLAAAALIIDKVLKWALSWKKEDKAMNQEPTNGHRQAMITFEQPAFVKHDAKSDLLCANLTKLCDAHEEMKEVETAQTNLLQSMADGGDRREKLLEKLLDRFDQGRRVL
jgi:hypothetical protein